MNDILIELHACDPANNRHRSWRVVAGADLFGLVVSVLVCAYLLYALLRGERF